MPTTPAVARQIDDVSTTHFLETKNLAYMIYAVSSRALPLVTSGVKPGAQRLLYSMLSEGIIPGSKARKSAKITSAATGVFHPHGQSAMYGTLTTLAQPFSRIQLIEGVGSFGIAPGDPPAADRYTEARLSKAGMEVVKEVASGGVPMRPTYDGETTEPLYLPARFPVLLCLGAEGIGEGWATKIPQHNPREVIRAALALLNNPDISAAELLTIIPGPDWGTGGEIIGSKDGIEDYVTTGRGKLTVRGKILKGKNSFTIVEVPPMVSVPTLLEGSRGGEQATPGLKEMARTGAIAGIADITDLTDLQNGLHIEVAVKRGFSVDTVLADVLAKTALETTYAASLVALDMNGVPRWWTVKEILEQFLTMRDAVIVSRSVALHKKLSTDLLRAKARAVVVLDKDVAVGIIRHSESKAEAIDGLCRHYRLSPEQGEYVVEMALYRLSKADTLRATQRVEHLETELAEIQHLLESPNARAEVIGRELEDTLGVFPAEAYARRTVLSHTATPTARGDQLSDQDQLALWRLDTTSHALGSGDPIPAGSSVFAAFVDGKIKRFDGGGLPKNQVIKPIAPDIERVIATGVYDPAAQHIVFVTAGKNTSSAAKVLRLNTQALRAQSIAGNGVSGIKLTDDDHLVGVFAARGDQQLLLVSETGWKVLSIDDIPVQGTGSRGVGVFRITAKDPMGIVSAEVGDTFSTGDKLAAPTSRAAAPHRGSAPPTV